MDKVKQFFSRYRKQVLWVVGLLIAYMVYESYRLNKLVAASKDYIPTNAEWKSLIEQKAVTNGITFEEQLDRDARYIARGKTIFKFLV